MNEDLPRSRAEAKKLGTKHYFTGNPCSRGLIARRLTSCALCQCDDCLVAQRESNRKSPKHPLTPEQRESARLYSKRYHAQNRDDCLEKMRERNKRYYLKNKERIKKQALTYQTENAEKRNAYKVAWSKRRIESDPAFRMHYAARRMVHRALGVAGQKKYKRTTDYLGYTSGQLVDHLERQFKKGMSWANYGQWHIDHIVPIAEFTRQGVTDPKTLNALPNLRPIWAGENMAKGSDSHFLI